MAKANVQRNTPMGIADNIQKNLKATKFEPPSNLTATQREFWDDVVATRSPAEWPRADLPLLKAYVKAWSDIEEIQAKIDKQGFLSANGFKHNPYLPALNYRMQHMALLYHRLGLASKKVTTPSDALAQARGRDNVKNAIDALSSDEDGLLAA